MCSRSHSSHEYGRGGYMCHILFAVRHGVANLFGNPCLTKRTPICRCERERERESESLAALTKTSCTEGKETTFSL